MHRRSRPWHGAAAPQGTEGWPARDRAAWGCLSRLPSDLGKAKGRGCPTWGWQLGSSCPRTGPGCESPLWERCAPRPAAPFAGGGPAPRSCPPAARRALGSAPGAGRAPGSCGEGRGPRFPPGLTPGRRLRAHSCPPPRLNPCAARGLLGTPPQHLPRLQSLLPSPDRPSRRAETQTDRDRWTDGQAEWGEIGRRWESFKWGLGTPSL